MAFYQDITSPTSLALNFIKVFLWKSFLFYSRCDPVDGGNGISFRVPHVVVLDKPTPSRFVLGSPVGQFRIEEGAGFLSSRISSNRTVANFQKFRFPSTRGLVKFLFSSKESKVFLICGFANENRITYTVLAFPSINRYSRVLWIHLFFIISYLRVYLSNNLRVSQSSI